MIAANVFGINVARRGEWREEDLPRARPQPLGSAPAGECKSPLQPDHLKTRSFRAFDTDVNCWKTVGVSKKLRRLSTVGTKKIRNTVARWESDEMASPGFLHLARDS